jgi:hypothetical protein
MFDATAWISVLGLLDECPVLPAALTAILEGRHAHPLKRLRSACAVCVYVVIRTVVGILARQQIAHCAILAMDRERCTFVLTSW